MKRFRILISLCLFSLVLVLTSCGGNKEEVNIYNWGDYLAPKLIKQFEKEYGIKVNYDTFDTNEDMYIKIKKGGSYYDIIVPSDYMIEKMVKEDMLEEIETSELENFDGINELFRGKEFDPEDKYSIPFFWGTVGICYNSTMVNEPVDSWDILWDEKYKGEIIMLNSQRDTIGVALMKLGYSMNSRDPDELEEAKNELIKQKPLVKAYMGDNVEDTMISGEAVMGIIWSCQEPFDENEDLKYAIPKSGSNIWFDNMAIPKGAKNKGNAMKFIDFMLRPEVAAENAIYMGYASPVKSAIDYMPEKALKSEIINPDFTKFPKLETFKDPEDVLKIYEKIWMEVIASD